MIINLLIHLSQVITPSDPSQIVEQFLPITMEYVTAIVTYVNEFVQFIMPLFIYVIVFKIVIQKS